MITPLLKVTFPTRVKRFILVSSLFASITKRDSVSDETLQKLNQALHLVSDDNCNSMILPITIKSLIWNGTEIELVREDAMNSERQERCVDRICGMIPEWLRYTGEKEDVSSLIKYLHVFS